MGTCTSRYRQRRPWYRRTWYRAPHEWRRGGYGILLLKLVAEFVGGHLVTTASLAVVLLAMPANGAPVAASVLSGAVAVSSSSGSEDRKKWIQLVGLHSGQEFLDFVDLRSSVDPIKKVPTRDDVSHRGGEDDTFIVEIFLEVALEFEVSSDGSGSAGSAGPRVEFSLGIMASGTAGSVDKYGEGVVGGVVLPFLEGLIGDLP